MKKKSLLLLLVIGICTLCYAQKESSAVQSRFDRAKISVQSQNDSLLNQVQRKLINPDANKKLKIENFNKMQKQKDNQFFYEKSKLESVLNLKQNNQGLKNVFNKLCDKKYAPTQVYYEKIEVGAPKYSVIPTGKNQGNKDTLNVLVPVTFQVHSIAKDSSDIKYNVSFSWSVKFDKKKDKSNPPVLISSSAEKIAYMSSEISAMQESVRSAVVDWYANLPEKIDLKYKKDAIMEFASVTLSASDIKEIQQDKKNPRTFIIKGTPQIKVDLDPYTFIKEDEANLYTDPVAYKILEPTFNVNVDASLKTADITNVSYKEVKIVEPIKDQKLEEMRTNANNTVSEYANQLSYYVQSPSKDAKTILTSKFVSPKAKMEVSYMPKNGKEKIKTENCGQYIDRVKGESLNMSVDNQTVEGDCVVYTVTQKYSGKSYSDVTKKRIYMKYDSAKESYLIDKIEIVPNSTVRTDNGSNK